MENVSLRLCSGFTNNEIGLLKYVCIPKMFSIYDPKEQSNKKYTFMAPDDLIKGTCLKPEARNTQVQGPRCRQSNKRIEEKVYQV